MWRIFTFLIGICFIILGLYVGIGYMFIGGVVDVVTQIRAVTMNVPSLATGIAKIIFCELPIAFGWLVGILFFGISVVKQNNKMFKKQRKFYVRSGQLEVVIAADSPEDACDKAIDRANGETLDPHYFFVDERGHRGPIYNKNGITQCTTDDLEPEWKIPTDDVISTFGSDEDSCEGSF